MSTADGDAPRPADAPEQPVSAPATGGVSVRSSADSARPTPAPGGCPFLLAEAGGWRLDLPSREHRCGAFSPASPLAPEKQQRLCLTATHTSCATYIASISARTERLGTAPVSRATRWGLARTTSVIEDPGGIRGRLVAALLDRRRWPAIPAVLLVATLITLALSGFRTGTPSTAGSTAGPTPPTATSVSQPTARPSASGPGAGASVPPTPEPTEPPASPAATVPATPAPSATFRTYRVVSGDTLGAIASRFGVTVKAIASLNGISDPARLQVGQVLLIP